MTTPFYIIQSEESSEGTFRFRVVFDAGHAVFAGHFPGRPIVPGVFLTEIIRDCVNIFKSNIYKISGITSIKYLNVIDPGETPEVTLSGTIVEESEGKLTLNAQFSAGEVVFARMKGINLTSTAD
jgi:3-hydroxyacyl-[acyl-carrier-protein] dehydratase